MGKLRKLGSKLASGIRKIGRKVKKAFSKITRAFGKLGPLGHLAMFFILPGMGNVLTSWMGQFGKTVMNFLPKGFGQTLTNIGSRVMKGASYVFDNTIGAIHRTISGALTRGLDIVSSPFTGTGPGLGTRLENFVTSVNEGIQNKLGPDVTPEIANAQNIELTDQEIYNQTGVSKEIAQASTAEIKSIQGLSKGFKDPVYQFNEATGKYEIFEAKDLEAFNTGKVTDLPKPKVVEVTPKQKGIIDRGLDKYKEFKQTVKTTAIPGTEISIGEAAAVGKDATALYGAYEYFNPENVDTPFYNPLTNYADDLLSLTQRNQFSTSNMEQANFISLPEFGSSKSLYDLGQAYVQNTYGNIAQGTDPLALALQSPGYGFNFNQYALYGIGGEE